MEIKDIEKRVAKLEEKQNELQLFVNKSISNIQIGIAEIKVMLKERLEQDNLKNDLLAKDIHSHDDRLKKIEDNQQWLWRTVVGSIITAIGSVIIFVIQMMK